MASVTLSNFPGSQVELLSGSSPEFAQLLTDFAGPQTVSTLLPITPYLVIAKNTGTATIRSITITWRWHIQGMDQIGGLNSRLDIKHGCFPGQAVLMGPLSGLSTLLVKQINYGSSSALQSPSNLNGILDSFLRNLKPASDISIELDSVIFRDHTYVGPDHSGKIGEEQNERRIKYQLAAEVLNLAPSDRMAYLQPIIDAWKRDESTTPVEVADRSGLAQSMKGLVIGAGSDDALFRRSLENIIHDETPELRKRQVVLWGTGE